MTDRDELHSLRAYAKQYGRANRVPHHEALNLIAEVLGLPHWNAVTKKAKGGWCPSDEQLAEVLAFVGEPSLAHRGPFADLGPIADPHGDLSPIEEGNIGPHPYQIEEILDDVYIRGKGWRIVVGEAPSAQPVVEVTDRRFKSNPIQDPEFVQQALKIAQARAERVRARISSDWPRRSTKPDAEGRTRHPLWGGLAKEWFCFHCDGKFSGADMAGNMWHCPDCGATPIDIYNEPYPYEDPVE